jgi:hypothetical protein
MATEMMAHRRWAGAGVAEACPVGEAARHPEDLDNFVSLPASAHFCTAIALYILNRMLSR